MSKFQKFEVRRIHRSELNPAGYNPRKIDSYTEKKLRETMQKLGLLEPLVWNERTGNLVGGHQRLKQLDKLERGTDYELDVSVVSLTGTEEKAANIALNNPLLAGEWDIPAVKALALELGQDAIDLTGFDAVDLSILTGEKLFGEDAAVPPDLAELELDARPTPAASNAPVRGKEEILASRKDYDKAYAKKNNSELFSIVVWASEADRDEFLKAVGCDNDPESGVVEREISGARVLHALGLP